MNLAARMNLQRGIPENKMNDWTNYSAESPLDAYLVQRQQVKESYKQQRRGEQQQKALEEYINKLIEEKLGDCLGKTLDDVLKDFK